MTKKGHMADQEKLIMKQQRFIKNTRTANNKVRYMFKKNKLLTRRTSIYYKQAETGKHCQTKQLI